MAYAFCMKLKCKDESSPGSPFQLGSAEVESVEKFIYLGAICSADLLWPDRMDLVVIICPVVPSGGCFPVEYCCSCPWKQMPPRALAALSLLSVAAATCGPSSALPDIMSCICCCSTLWLLDCWPCAATLALSDLPLQNCYLNMPKCT